MTENLLHVWASDLAVSCHGHYESAKSQDGMHTYLGVPIVILSGIAGTSVFASLADELGDYAKITVGLISLTVAILGALQTFFRFAEKAEKHRESGARFGSLLKEVEQYQVIKINNKDFRIWADNFRARWDELSAEAPTIPDKIYQKHYKLQKNEHNKTIQSTAEELVV